MRTEADEPASVDVLGALAALPLVPHRHRKRRAGADR
jgi:hypothetical protein